MSDEDAEAYEQTIEWDAMRGNCNYIDTGNITIYHWWIEYTKAGVYVGEFHFPSKSMRHSHGYPMTRYGEEVVHADFGAIVKE